MRLWSLSPTYLDRQGLCGNWVEALLCQKVLTGAAKGYKHHPQLQRWKALAQPLVALGCYLSALQLEGTARGYRFNRDLLHPPPATTTTTTTTAGPAGAVAPSLMEVTVGQLQYEMQHLLHKLKARDPERYQQHKLLLLDAASPSSSSSSDPAACAIEPFPGFRVVAGGIEDWERIITEPGAAAAASSSSSPAAGTGGKVKAKGKGEAKTQQGTGTEAAATAAAAAAAAAAPASGSATRGSAKAAAAATAVVRVQQTVTTTTTTTTTVVKTVAKKKEGGAAKRKIPPSAAGEEETEKTETDPGRRSRRRLGSK